MRLLKAFVIGMGLLIVVGGALLVWGLAHQWNRSTAQAAATPTTAETDTGYASADIPAPSGMSLAQMATTGDRLLLRFSGPQGERIIVVDPRTGRITGNIAVTPAAP
jgi:hypothetical protein